MAPVAKVPAVVATQRGPLRQINPARVLSEGQRRTLLDAGLAFAEESRRVIHQMVAKGFKVETKKDGTYVTDADREAERVLRDAISKRFPDHGIIGEEFDAVRPKAEFQWVIDPIDGTLSFVNGLPTFGTILAVRYREETVAGVIDLPAMHKRYGAAVGLGAFCDGKPLVIRDASSERNYPEEIIAVCDRAQFRRVGRERTFDDLVAAHPRVRIYTDCFGHAMAAAGAVGAMVDVGIHLWDIAATQVLVEEAGGRFEILQGFEKAGAGTLYSIVCGKPGVVGWLLPQLKR